MKEVGEILLQNAKYTRLNQAGYLPTPKKISVASYRPFDFSPEPPRADRLPVCQLWHLLFYVNVANMALTIPGGGPDSRICQLAR